MILCKPFDKGDLVDFDVRNCSVRACTDTTVSPRGNIHLLLDKCIAIYCEDGTLILQIDKNKWDISSKETVLRYFHRLIDKTTHFEVVSEKESVSIAYRAWWAEIPDFALFEPEMDEDEDFLGYVFAIWRSKQLQESLIESWG